MYFRIKNTRTTSALQLVESYRNEENQPRQKILLSLGNIDIRKEIWQEVITEIENILNNTPVLFRPSVEVKEWAEKIAMELQKKSSSDNRDEPGGSVEVDVDDVFVEDVRELGPELAAKRAYDALCIDNILEKLGFNPVQRRDIAISLINRLCDPVSEHRLPDWVNSTALGDLFGERLTNLGDDRFHRIADKILSVKEDLERELSEKEKTLFSLDRSIYLYDLTNTYFEGIMSDNELAKRGHSKEKRTDAPLISCGMVLDKDGFIVQHKVYPGNIGESKTLEKVVSELNLTCPEKPIIIIDSGISSDENLEMVKKMGFDYITVGKRPGRLAYSELFENMKEFRSIQKKHEKEEVYIRAFETEHEKLVACISESRKEKEKAILSNAEEKYLLDLEKLKERILKGKLKNKSKVEQKIGRLAERHSRVARYYSVSFNSDTNTFNYEKKDSKYEEAFNMSGGYVLRTNRKTLSDEEIWRLYIMLTRVEKGFRTLKSDLGLRPVYHRKTDRAKAHIFITILGYHLLHWIETTMKKSGKLMSWEALKILLRTHSYSTVVLPSKNQGVIRVRKPSKADARQEEVYKILGVNLKALPCFKSKQ